MQGTAFPGSESKYRNTDAEYSFLATEGRNLEAYFEELGAILPGVLMLLLDG